MPWVKLDDQFWSNRKVRRAGQAIGAYTICLTWCSSELTDGFIPEDELQFICSGIESPESDMERLVKVGLLRKAVGGWEVPGYLEFNPSKAETLAKRAKDRARKQAQGTNGGSARNPSGSRPESERTPQGIQTASGSPVPSRPDPVTTPLPPSCQKGGQRSCPRCSAGPGEPCRTANGTPRIDHHTARLKDPLDRIVKQDSVPIAAIPRPGQDNPRHPRDQCACEGVGTIGTPDGRIPCPGIVAVA